MVDSARPLALPVDTPPPSVSLDSTSVRTLTSPCNDYLVIALQKKSYQRMLLRLWGINRRLLTEAPDLAESSGFTDAFSLLCTYPGFIQQAVLSYPSVAFWVDVSEDLLRRQAHVKFPEMHVGTHLESFWRTALAASAMTSSGTFSCRTRTDVAARLCLPGAKCYFQLPDKCSHERVSATLNNGELHIEGSSVSETKRLRIPDIQGIELNWVDSDLRLPGRTDFPYQDLNAIDILKWESPIDQSLDWIHLASPEMFREIQRAVRCIVPVCADRPDVHTSASFREAPGLMVLSWTPDAAVMVEAIVHEYHHNKLNSLLMVDRLIVGPTDDAVYYSPWRLDPRPLSGILHGAFVFQAVLEFWHNFFSAGIPLLQRDRIRHRMYLIQSQTRQALRILEREGEFSDLGHALLEAMKGNVERFKTELPERESAIQRKLDHVQEDHRTEWEKNRTPTLKVRQRSTTSDLPGASHPILNQIICILGIKAELPARVDSLPVNDVLLEHLVECHANDRLGSIIKLIATNDPGYPPLLNLLAGHVFYILAQFEQAAFFYARLVQQLPRCRYFWLCFGFAIRHISYLDEGTSIITHLGLLASAARCCEEGQAAISERLAEAKRILGEEL